MDQPLAFYPTMPPQRTIPPSKVVKTERTHEENQERYVAGDRACPLTVAEWIVVPISQRREEVTEVWKRELSPHDGHPRFIRNERAAHCG